MTAPARWSARSFLCLPPPGNLEDNLCIAPQRLSVAKHYAGVNFILFGIEPGLPAIQVSLAWTPNEPLAALLAEQQNNLYPYTSC